MGFYNCIFLGSLVAKEQLLAASAYLLKDEDAAVSPGRPGGRRPVQSADSHGGLEASLCSSLLRRRRSPAVLRHSLGLGAAPEGSTSASASALPDASDRIHLFAPDSWTHLYGWTQTPQREQRRVGAPLLFRLVWFLPSRSFLAGRWTGTSE